MAKRIYARNNKDYQNRIVRQLQNEADRILQQMREQFVRDLKQQLADAIQSESTSSASSDGSSSGSNEGSPNYTSLFSSAMRYLLRPKANISQQETSRSAATLQQFRLSQSQAAAEANAALVRAKKNS